MFAPSGVQRNRKIRAFSDFAHGLKKKANAFMIVKIIIAVDAVGAIHKKKTSRIGISPGFSHAFPPVHNTCNTGL